MSLESACRSPVQTVLSGPAGGVSGASFVASHAGFDRILTFDMGGTSTDVAVCVSGRPEITRETNVGEFPVRAPAVDVASIGAGGGSIAYVADATGALRVGPESAGCPSRPRLLRPRGHGSDGHGRQRRPRPPTAAPARRRARAGRRGSVRGGRAGRRGPRDGRRGDRASDREHGRRGDARSAARRHRPARAGAERVRARRLRRRRRPPRERAREHPRQLPRHRPRGVGRALGARVHLLRDQERVQPDVREKHRDDDAGRGARALRGAHGAGPRLARRRRASTSPTRTFASSSTCATAGRATRSRSSWTASSSPRSTSPRSSGASARPTAVCTASCSPGAPRSSTSGSSPPAASRCPSSRRTPRATRIRPRRRRARSSSGLPRDPSTCRPMRGPRSSRGWRSTATRSSSSTTRPRSCSRGTARGSIPG